MGIFDDIVGGITAPFEAWWEAGQERTTLLEGGPVKAPAQEQPGAATEAASVEDQRAMSTAVLQGAAARYADAIQSRDLTKEPTTLEEMTKLVTLANATRLPSDYQAELQQQALLDKVAEDFNRVSKEGTEEEMDAFIAGLGTPEYAGIVESIAGGVVDQTQDEFAAEQEKLVRLQELEYERTALLDYVDMFPEQIRGSMLMDMIENPRVQEMFFPGLNQPTAMIENPTPLMSGSQAMSELGMGGRRRSRPSRGTSTTTRRQPSRLPGGFGAPTGRGGAPVPTPRPTPRPTSPPPNYRP